MERLAAIRDAHGGDKIFYYGGGGQGNHLPGAYPSATRSVFGVVYRSSALAQEKVGEFWVNGQMFGTMVKATFTTATSRFSSARIPGTRTVYRGRALFWCTLVRIQPRQ